MRKPLLVSILCICTGGCGDSGPFHYDYNGSLIETDGKPAVGVKLFVENQEGLRFYPTDETRCDHWRYWGATTDRQGRFAGKFNTTIAYYKWLDLFPIIPPAKPLARVYLIVNRQGKWTTIDVPLNADAQRHGYEGGRHLDLPPAVLKQALEVIDDCVSSPIAGSDFPLSRRTVWLPDLPRERWR